MNALALGLLAVGIVGAILRPRGLPEYVVPTGARQLRRARVAAVARVNLGPLVLLTGSLAGLLWQSSARRAGLEILAIQYTRVGVLVGLPAMVAGYLTLRLLG